MRIWCVGHASVNCWTCTYNMLKYIFFVCMLSLFCRPPHHPIIGSECIPQCKPLDSAEESSDAWDNLRCAGEMRVTWPRVLSSGSSCSLILEEREGEHWHNWYTVSMHSTDRKHTQDKHSCFIPQGSFFSGYV